MESGKYEGDNRKKYKTANKGIGLLPTSKLNENKAKVNSKKTKEIFNEFPNFTALTEEERLAFFEILNAARKNVEETNKEDLSCNIVDSSQDELLQYFDQMFLQGEEKKKISSHDACNSIKNLQESKQEQILKNSAFNLSQNFDPDDLFLLDKNFKCDSASVASLSAGQSGTEKENYAKCIKSFCSSKKNSSNAKTEAGDRRQRAFNKDQNKIVNLYLKSKMEAEKKNEPNQTSEKSSPLNESTANEDTWSDKTYDVKSAKFDLETVPNKKKISEQNENNLPTKATPKFDALSAEEKKIFFNVLQEAHENILQKNLQNESGILPFESVIKNYRMENNESYNYHENSINPPTLNFPIENNKNIKVKVTLTSTDNQRLEKELEEENYNRMKLLREIDNIDKKESNENLNKKKENKDEAGNDKKKDTGDNNSSDEESCEDLNEPAKNETTDKEEMNKIYRTKKKLIESKIKLSMKEQEANKKLKGEDCSLDENEKINENEAKEIKSDEKKSSDTKRADSKPLQVKSTETKENASAESFKAKNKDKYSLKKLEEKRFLGIPKSKREGKDKSFHFKNTENEVEASVTKSETKKEKEVVQVESVSVHEFKKNKLDEKSRSDITQKSWKVSEENMLQAEKPKLKISTYQGEISEDNKKVENKEAMKVIEECQTEIKQKESKSDEISSHKDNDEIFIESNIPKEKDLSQQNMDFKILSNKIFTVSREDQNSTITNNLLERNSQRENDQSQVNQSTKNRTFIQENEIKEKDKNSETVSKEIETSNEPLTDLKGGKVVLVDDGVIDKIKQLIEDLEKNAKAEEDSLSIDYVHLLLDYISYLSRVLCSLVGKRDEGVGIDITQVQTSLTSPDVHLKLEKKRKCKPKSKPKSTKSGDEILHERSKTKLDEKKSSLLSATSRSPSPSVNEEDETFWAPMFVKQKILPSTKIRLLQDLLKERAKFVEGSISEFKIIQLPQEDYVPAEKPVLRLNIEDEEEGSVEKATKFNLFKAFFRFCRCGKKETGDEHSILENLKGEAVAVDTSETQAKNPASATINDSTMEVLKAAERKKIIQKYWKYN